MHSCMQRVLGHSSKSKADQSRPRASIWLATVFTPIELLFSGGFLVTRPQVATTLNFAREFPFDIITEILGHASQVIDKDTEPRFIVSPFLLSRVCKSWRSYLHTTPSFWSSIIISLSLAKRWRNLYIAGLNVWLKRAGYLPLDIYLYGGADSDMWSETVVLRNQVCQFLVNCRSRSRSIDICSDDHNFALACLYRTYTPPGMAYYPLLQSYVIRMENTPFLTDFQRVPALETLQINGYNNHITRWKLDPHLIRNINFTTTQGIAANAILSSYPLLQTADIQYPFQHSIYLLFDRKVIRHDHIRLLKITTKTSSYITDSLSRLQAPKLEDLQLCSPDVFNGEWFDVISSIDDFVARSRCHLVRLCLQIHLLQESLFIRMSCFLPSLEELDVHHVETVQSYKTFGGLTRAFFRKLHPHADTAFLPNLRILTYEGPLAIETLDPLEALVLRLFPGRQHLLPSPGLDPPARVACQPHSTTVKLNFAKIVAEQKDRRLSRDFAVKAELLAQINSLVDSNALWLLNADGSRWE